MADEADVKRLRKSRADRMIDGVCGGIAEYFRLDPTLVRIATVLLGIFGGIGIVLYIVAMIIMPSDRTAAPAPSGAAEKSHSKNNERFWGILLVVVGGVWLLANMGVGFWHPWSVLSWGVFFPLLLILAGVAFLFGGRNYISGPAVLEEAAEPAPGSPETRKAAARRLYRSRGDRKIMGVCSGLGAHFNIDPTIVRLLVVMAGLASFGFTVLCYVVLAIIVPAEPEPVPAA